ncbi:MAG TPA: permease-like cell division protein FtsX [Solirubrobacterales bacterium]|jgi:cell division transport system permease protein|nr:permease-like cell division protein FtsX [Solirubrobacterales bacterium]
MNWRFFLSEAFRALSRNAAPSIAALVTVMITTIVLGVFIPVTDATTGAANEIRSRLLVDVYLKDKAAQPDIAALRQKLERDPRVRSVEYVSKAAALKSLDTQLREGTETLGENPLPASFRVTPKNPDQVSALAASLKRTSGDKTSFTSPAVNDVRNREDETDKILSITGGVKWAMWGLAIMLLLASTVLVANTIRLSIYARRREVEVMRLVGATSWFIRWPFVIEGIFVGAAGGSIAVLLLLVAKQTILDPLSESFALFAAPDTIGFVPLAIILLLSAMAISAVGSGVTLRRFLRV